MLLVREQHGLGHIWLFCHWKGTIHLLEEHRQYNALARVLHLCGQWHLKVRISNSLAARLCIQNRFQGFRDMRLNRHIFRLCLYSYHSKIVWCWWEECLGNSWDISSLKPRQLAFQINSPLALQGRNIGLERIQLLIRQWCQDWWSRMVQLMLALSSISRLLCHL